MGPLPELLSPAGDEAALRAAVDCGADAVYLGCKAFGARASASNFDDEGLARAVDYAHLYHVRVHVTVNTLVKESEWADVARTLQGIADTGADAVIVQDLGVARLARERFPSLLLHASTQMALSNADDARFARDFGFSRVVLARECGLEDIRRVAETGIETEVFAHGALCAGVSGRCLMSSMAGGRSGNRGRCAQPCRQQVRLDGREGALLSLRDLCTWERLPALWDAGVAALKIEGRLKSAEYVAVVTETYRRALDAMLAGTFDPEDPGPKERLLQIFNRGGFTRGHAFGAQDAELAAPERVSHEGVALGEIVGVKGQLAALRTCKPLHDGDSLQIRARQDLDLRYAGRDTEAGETTMLRLRPDMLVRVGSPVARLCDARQLEAARTHPPRPIPVVMRACFQAGQPMRLTLSDGDSVVTVEGDKAQAARTRASGAEEARKSLSKLGDSPFVLLSATDLTLEMEEGLFLPVSALNALRREGLERLRLARIRAFGARNAAKKTAEDTVAAGKLTAGAGEAPGKHDTAVNAFGDAVADTVGNGVADTVVDAVGNTVADTARNTVGNVVADTAGNAVADTAASARFPAPLSAPVTPQTLAVSFSDPGLAQSLTDSGATLLLYQPRSYRPAELDAALSALPPGTWLTLSPQMSERTLEEVARLIERHRNRLAGLVANSLGQLNLVPDMPVFMGDAVPFTNREALRGLAETAACAFTLWPEWTFIEQRELLPCPVPTLLKVYGRERLMLLNHCPERVARGLNARRESCALCTDLSMACGRRNAELTDRKGYLFPLTRTVFPEGCVLSVWNALPTDLRAWDAERRELGAGMLLSFTVETPEAQLTLTRTFAALLRGEKVAPAENATAGHWKRGVE